MLRRLLLAVFSCRLLLPSAVYAFLLPGLTANSPRAQASQTVGSTEATSSVASAIRFTPTSALPEERSMIDAAPTTSAPSSRNASIVSRVDPPVVTTSSITRIVRLATTEKPRRRIILPFSRSVQMNRTPSARATSCPITIPPIAGAATALISASRNSSAIACPNSSAAPRILEHQRALQIDGSYANRSSAQSVLQAKRRSALNF